MSTRDQRTLRYASIVAMILGLILFVMGVFAWYERRASAAPITSGLAAVVIGGVWYQRSRTSKPRDDTRTGA